MGRFVLGAAGALLVGLAVWAAWPSAPPLAGSSRGMPSSELVGPTPIVPKGVANPIASPPAADELDVRIAGCIGATRNVAAARAKRGGPAPAGAAERRRGRVARLRAALQGSRRAATR